MPARVHALVVVRPDVRTPAAFHLRRTLAALGQQTRPVDALTIIICGDDERVREVAGLAPGAEIVSVPGATRFAAATARADIRGDALWLLGQDTAPEPEALARLVGALEVAPSVALVAPKLVQWDDRSVIVSLGQGLTRLGRTVELADGDHDQGQHDGTHDVLGADVRGILVRRDSWQVLGGLNPALSGADEGLDLSVRARLAGARVALAPTARIAVAGDGVTGLPDRATPGRMCRRGYAGRVAQLHRRLVYAPPALVLLHWISMLPLALWRTVVHLLRKQPARILPEWGAAAVSWVRVPALIRWRAQIRRTRVVPWSQLTALRFTRAELRRRLGDEGFPAAVAGQPLRTELRFFTGGGAWLVLAAAAVSVAAFPALLAWQTLGGGGLQPMQSSLAELWRDASFGARGVGLESITPADPFAAVVAVIGSAWPIAPSRALVLLWLAALPLAALGGWFLATRVTERSVLRIAFGVIWALAPTFLDSLTQGRPAAVITHLLMPWLFYAGTVAWRSWSAAGMASLLLAAVIACAPVLTPALLVLWTATVILTAARRSGRPLGPLLWLLVPTVVMTGPLVWWQLAHGNAVGLLADPGAAFVGTQVSADSAGRGILTAGIPSSDVSGWVTMLPTASAWWVPLLVAPLAVLAALAAFTTRWSVGIAAVVTTALGLFTAYAAIGISVVSVGAQPVALWPGTGLTLAWIGVLGGAITTVDAALARNLTAVRGIVAFTAVVAIAVLAVPNLTALSRGQSALTNGPTSTLPAYVAAQGKDNPDIATLVLTPQPSGGVAARVVWGESETLGGRSTAIGTRAQTSLADERLAHAVADLVASTSAEAVTTLAGAGVGFVLLDHSHSDDSGAASSFALEASSYLDQRDGLDPVGQTARGQLWRVTEAVQPRAQAPAPWWEGLLILTQLIVTGIALLLAIPTTDSRREARHSPRRVGVRRAR